MSDRLSTVVAKPGEPIDLGKIDPEGDLPLDGKELKKRLNELEDRSAELQERLFAEHRRSLLILFQAMDTGGKDGAIKRLCRGLDPSGVHLTNFKYPSAEEWDHDFLWRIHKAAPRKGTIGIWNRSHYEDVIVPGVNRSIDDDAWQKRCEDINAFERLLHRNGVTWLKFFLYISKDEQRERLKARLKDPAKHWKFNPGDLKERAKWNDYMETYEAVINACTTEDAAWHIVPANRKKGRDLLVMEAVVGTLEKMDPQYPAPDFDPKRVVVK